MNLLLDNVDVSSTSGPNHFGKKLKKYLKKKGVKFDSTKKPDIQLSFIESRNVLPQIPIIQRLDGIYFNKTFDFGKQNSNILSTYKGAKGVVFQTDFNRRLTFQYFGYHENSTVIRNGADMELISEVEPLNNELLARYENVWCCASSWRPHKRLEDNIKYFLKKSDNNDCMVVAGTTDRVIEHERVYYAGNLPVEKLLSLYKTSKYFVHLAWLDHCPNVVADARASGCEIICSSTGGTREIAGPNARIVMETEWDFSPVDLYDPPKVDYSYSTINGVIGDNSVDMTSVSQKYYNFLEKNI